MSNSPLVNYTKISPNSSARGAKIDTITIHHMAGNLSVEACAEVFQNTSRQASSNYGVGTDGRIGLYVPENRRAWTSSNRDNDNRAVTIEVANCGGAPNWPVSDTALEATIELCVDICRRNGIARLNYTGDKTGNLTMHKWFTNTLCPGPYLGGKFQYIADQVNTRLGASAAPETPAAPKPTAGTYRVQVGAYGTEAGAEWRCKQVAAAGFTPYVVQADEAIWRVQVGSYDRKEDAELLESQLRAVGFPGIVTTLGGSTAKQETTEPSTSDPEEVVDVKVAVLKKGAKGDQVKALQALLIGYGYDLGVKGVDGSFGPTTDSRVRQYQSRNGLEPDGSVGPATWRKLLGA